MVITVLLVVAEWGFWGFNRGVDASRHDGDDDCTCGDDDDGTYDGDDGGQDDWAAANDQHCLLIQHFFSIHRLIVLSINCHQ